MPTNFVAPTANYVQKALSGSIDDSVTTITLNNTTNLQAPGYIVIDRVNSSGVATPNSREVVSFTGISGNDLTGCVRGADNSTARSHNDAAIVETVPAVGMWNNLATIVASGFDNNGYLRAINSPVSIANLFSNFISLPRVAVTSVVSAALVKTPLIEASSAIVSVATVLAHFNASGASLSGNIMRTDIKARAFLNSNASASNLPDATFTKVLLDTESYDVGGNMAVAVGTNKFTAPVAGYYQVSAVVGLTGTGTDKTYHAALYKNGSIYSEAIAMTSAALDIGIPVSDVIPLAVNDTVELYVRADDVAATADVKTGTSLTYLTVHLISV